MVLSRRCLRLVRRSSVPKPPQRTAPAALCGWRYAGAMYGQRRGRRGYHEPEDLGAEQDRRDAAVPGRRFYVYVLDTDRGHYVGHSARVSARAQEHTEGHSPSTAGANPELVWISRPLKTRAEAARFEAAMKALRDQRAERFREITRLVPQPFAYPARRPRPATTDVSGCFAALVWSAAALLLLWWLFG